MNLQLKPCYFCGGKYEKVIVPKGMEDYAISTAIIHKIGDDEVTFAQSLAYSCTTCGNILGRRT